MCARIPTCLPVLGTVAGYGAAAGQQDWGKKASDPSAGEGSWGKYFAVESFVPGLVAQGQSLYMQGL